MLFSEIWTKDEKLQKSTHGVFFVEKYKSKNNKAITMMRGKSPQSDVEMSKKLNFMAAILDFWRPFLNQFWPNLVHTYKIHFWISFVLCVVFKCQYFWSYSRKPHFWPFMYIFQRAVTHSKIVRLTRFFSTGSGHSN